MIFRVQRRLSMKEKKSGLLENVFRLTSLLWTSGTYGSEIAGMIG